MSNMELFNEQGCLTAEGIVRYVKNDLSHNDLLRADQHLTKCDLCNASISGVAQLSHTESFTKNVRDLKKRWQHKHAAKSTTSRRIIYLYGSVAASVAILAGIFFLAGKHNPGADKRMAYIPANMISIDSVAKFYGNIVPIETNTQPPQIKEKNAREKFINSHGKTEKENRISASVKNARIVARNAENDNDIDIGEIDNFILENSPTHSTLMSHPPLNDDDLSNDDEKTQTVFTICENMPRFEDGGLREFSRYVHKEIRYPKAALNAGIEGRVYVQFTIDENGKLINPKILKGCNVLLEKEVLRVLNNSPRWVPGMQSGIYVNVSMTMPIEFHIHN